MKMQKFRIRHATATPKPQFKRHMRDAITLALRDTKARQSFEVFMRQACAASPFDRCPHYAARSETRLLRRTDLALRDLQARPAAQQR
ncbi:hypothetical protein [Burkholderia vietnamiensis]|uniref:hypothetical protein n=1 Tax=Burkholderia vietnamiensis TaxID=60552 RepID=UPI001CF481DF|nr:hypothetical protein [Burkholderia vietnamiensis]MCA8269304.1 hypothetical protein [Burkholderia vietnamiensis]HDR9128589.1 hypothetical protein [Burkholderia vietnamiensis]